MTADERQSYQKRQGDLAAARKEGRTGHEEAEKERKRGPHTWRNRKQLCSKAKPPQPIPNSNS